MVWTQVEQNSLRTNACKVDGDGSDLDSNLTSRSLIPRPKSTHREEGQATFEYFLGYAHHYEIRLSDGIIHV